MSDALEIRAYATSLDYHSAQWASFVLSIGWTGTPEGNLGIVMVDLCRLDALSQSVNLSASAVQFVMHTMSRISFIGGLDSREVARCLYNCKGKF